MAKYIKYFGSGIAATLAATYVEKKILPNHLPSVLFETSQVAGLPRSFALVALVLVMSGMWLVVYGLKTGSLRKKYMAKAIKDGEKDAEERFGLPNLYVTGGGKHAKAFNCAQRSHQQIFETLPQFYVFTILGALEFPLTVGITTLLWAYARMKWAEGYAKSEGNPSKRYSHPLAYFIWIGLVFNMFTALYAICNISGIYYFW